MLKDLERGLSWRHVRQWLVQWVQGKHRFLVQSGSYDDRMAKYLGLDRIGDKAFFMGIAPRLFHSMRASQQTELQREFPLHVVCSWLGNSPRIAQQSYLLVTEEDFAKAAGVAKVMVEG